jgi:hypothetical protein
MFREGAFAAVFFDDGNDFVFDELARGLADQFFLVVELRIKIDKIHAAESSHAWIVTGRFWRRQSARARSSQFPAQRNLQVVEV